MDPQRIGMMSRLFNTPLLISLEAMEAVLAALQIPGPTLTGKSELTANLITTREHKSKDSLAVIPVHGLLTYRPDDSFLSFLFGQSSSYEEIRAQFHVALSDEAVKAIVFDIDSPGGEVTGVFDLADEIFQARGRKPIYAVANESAYSAAYAIASAADKIFLPRTGGVGSIGVIAVHMDQSGWDEKVGVRYTPIFAGARKNDFSPHAPLSDEALAVAQTHIEGLYNLFVDTVARNRNLNPADIRATEAAFYHGRDAVSRGLADAVQPWGLAVNTIFQENKRKGGSNQMSLKEQLETMRQQHPDETPQALAELGYVLKGDGVLVTPQELEKASTQSADKARTDALDYAAQIIDACMLADRPNLAKTLIAERVSLEDAGTRLQAEKAKDADKNAIRSTVGATSTGEVNPLIADARKRADAAVQTLKQ